MTVNGQKQVFEQNSVKVPGSVLPPDNNTGFYYDHQGVFKYARERGKTVSELSDAEKRAFLFKRPRKNLDV